MESPPPLFSRIAEGGEKKEQKKAAAESNFQGRGAGVGFFILSPPSPPNIPPLKVREYVGTTTVLPGFFFLEPMGKTSTKEFV